MGDGTRFARASGAKGIQAADARCGELGTFLPHVHAGAPCCTIATMVPLVKARKVRTPWLPAALFALAASLPCAGLGAGPSTTKDQPAHPTVRIPVEPLGYVPPARFFIPYRIPSATLDFLDATHLLFTFHIAKLMRREADQPQDDQDQTIRAVVLSLPEGHTVAEGMWRLHDRDRYLWMLGGGRFVMRQRNTLYEGDRSLVLRTFLHPEGALASVQLSPNADLMAVQFARPEKQEERDDNAPTLGDDAPHLPQHRQEYSLLLIDTEEKHATRAGQLSRAVVLPLVEGGYLGVRQEKAKQWSVVLTPFHGEGRTLATVTSACQPTVHAISEQAFLTESCIPFISDHLVDAFTLDGRKLWEQVWQSRFTWGTYAYSASGNRFAYGSVEMDHNLATLDPVDASSILGQPIGVFSVETGKLDLVLDASPVLTAGNNYALSPDGDRLAILRDGAIELYALPAVAPPAVASAHAGKQP